MKYIANPITSSSLSITLPSAGSVSFKGTHGNNGVFVLLDDGSHTYYVGNWASSGANGLLIRNNGSSSNLVDQRATDITTGVETTMYTTWNNGSWTYGHDTDSKTFTANYTPTILTNITIQGTSTMKDLIIKPL